MNPSPLVERLRAAVRALAAGALGVIVLVGAIGLWMGTTTFQSRDAGARWAAGAGEVADAARAEAACHEGAAQVLETGDASLAPGQLNTTAFVLGCLTTLSP